MRSSRPSLRSPLPFLLVVLASLAVAGCAAAPAATAATPVVSGAWIRAAAGPGLPAAAYLVIRNPGGLDETLTAVTSPGARSVELHRTSTHSGMTGMDHAEAIHIPAGGTVTLEPGGFHLMLLDPTAMEVGQSVDLLLVFEQAGPVMVKAQVRNG